MYGINGEYHGYLPVYEGVVTGTCGYHMRSRYFRSYKYLSRYLDDNVPHVLYHWYSPGTPDHKRSSYLWMTMSHMCSTIGTVQVLLSILVIEVLLGTPGNLHIRSRPGVNR